MYAWDAEWKGKQFDIKMLPLWLFVFAPLVKENYDMREQFKTTNVVETMPHSSLDSWTNMWLSWEEKMGGALPCSYPCRARETSLTLSRAQSAGTTLLAPEKTRQANVECVVIPHLSCDHNWIWSLVSISRLQKWSIFQKLQLAHWGCTVARLGWFMSFKRA